MSAGFTFDASVITEALKNIYEKNFNPMTDIEARLFSEFWSKINVATDIGLTQSGVNIEDEFRHALRYNNGVFAAFKTHQVQNDMAALLLDSNGVRRPFKEWVKDARPIADHQCYTWLKTEYSTAVNRAHQAADWIQFKQNADILPNLEWIPSTAPDPRELHRLFYGLILPIGHPFWRDHRPGDLWNCQCDLHATDAECTPEDEIPIALSKPASGLDNNPAKDGKLFSDSHPYIAKSHKGATEAVRLVMESDLVQRIILFNRLREDDNYIDVQFNPTTGGLMATHIEHNIDHRKGHYELNSQKAGFNAGDCVILEKEDHTVIHKRNTEGLWNGKTFEIKGCETGTIPNIVKGLKHAVSKDADISVLYFEGNFDKEVFEKALARYNGLKGKEGQWKRFSTIICVERETIVYKKSHQ